MFGRCMKYPSIEMFPPKKCVNSKKIRLQSEASQGRDWLWLVEGQCPQAPLHSWDYQTNHHHLWLQSLHFIHIISYPRVSLVLSNQPVVGPTTPPLQQSHIELCPRLLCCRPLYLSDRNMSRVVVTNLPSSYVGKDTVGICRRKSKNQHRVVSWDLIKFVFRSTSHHHEISILPKSRRQPALHQITLTLTQ